MALTPYELVIRLRDVYAATSEEELARETGLSVRTLNRWKAAKGEGRMPQFDAFVKALDLAGLLRLPEAEGAESALREARIRAAATRLSHGLTSMLAALEDDDGSEPLEEGLTP